MIAPPQRISPISPVSCREVVMRNNARDSVMIEPIPVAARRIFNNLLLRVSLGSELEIARYRLMD